MYNLLPHQKDLDITREKILSSLNYMNKIMKINSSCPLGFPILLIYYYFSRYYVSGDVV
ncbi:conserved hypothetical protein [Xenorhabdus nematophila F1]|uniref:Uncharacterized protein n=1 Tax=Xenorhabdus nematophila (strain ATCC 19061 / DSM 3370 / CCUG 14189 / LMG 1036 / NCIMB 9965 / AN6) TaxID=406817 RepID=D3VHK2_XENNA|nr:hypothetical protein XNC1_2592 [Xenorhabdus nematophila ATCC 19061]CCW32663.1 conserved hypothetical protein [Xenorhabdus nematophila F1]CEK23483.1 hypothetical protein XNC2_2489 [Xenorhabdus nematophila AN6/1]